MIRSAMILHAFRSACAAICLAFAVASAAQAAEPTGIWMTQNGDAHIRIVKCGANMCGTIVWLRNPIDAMTGEAPIDIRNPDPTQRDRKILGLRIFAMTPDSSGVYSGRIYNTDDGNSYPAKITLRPDQYLEIQGCSGAVCGKELWSKVEK
jgi:uncharacterized protein (DUF2147 family)